MSARQHVAQTSGVPYRRLPACGASKIVSALDGQIPKPIGGRRYGRLEVCATSKSEEPWCDCGRLSFRRAVYPHPDPLPRGEGTAVARFGLARDLVPIAALEHPAREPRKTLDTSPPLPRGEGRGEGDENAVSFEGINVLRPMSYFVRLNRPWLRASLLVGLLMLSNVGCAPYRADKLGRERTRFVTVANDGSVPMKDRIHAFDALLSTFASGTPEKVIDQYVGERAVTKSRISGPAAEDLANWQYSEGGIFSLSVIAPDGPYRWLTLEGDKVQ
jgi:hypothetical protein